MLTFDSNNANVEVLTFKEGLLSPMAHDLRIDVTRFDIEVEDGRVEGHFDLSSLVVVSALEGGEDKPGALSASDKQKIEKTIRNEVLHTQRYPECVFSADLQDLENDHVSGELELHGEDGDVRAEVLETETGVWVSVKVHQPDFGIKPYTAMLGSLRIRADVVIRVRLHGVTLDELQNS